MGIMFALIIVEREQSAHMRRVIDGTRIYRRGVMHCDVACHGNLEVDSTFGAAAVFDLLGVAHEMVLT